MHVPAAFALALLSPFAVAQVTLPLPSVAAATTVYDCGADAPMALPRLLKVLAGKDVVFLGETHVDDTTHRLELAVLEAMIELRHGQVVLSMEMFERDVQPVVDDYLAGRIDEAAFLHRSRPWGNYENDYRPLVETCKQHGVPVVAANFPTALRRKLGMGGKDAFAKLSAEELALMPETIHPGSAAYWQRVDRAVRGHMGGGGGGESPAERLYDGQNLWDNAMGDNVAKATAAHPDRLVLHVAGGFHLAYRDGTVAQFRLRNQTAQAAVVEIAPVPSLFAARPEKDRDQADYLIYAQALARSENDGTFAVEVPAELRFQLAAPSRGAPRRLLVWLPDRGTRTEDAFAYWQAALGDDVALAVVEPPFPERQDDLAMGGRYAIGDGFRSDYGRMQYGLERLVEYVARRHAIARDQVCIAGEGDGGAVVLWLALYGQWLDAVMLAIDPTDLGRLSMEALPDQAPAMARLLLAGQSVPADKLQHVAADYLKVGGKVEVVALADQRLGRCDLVRQACGLAAAARAGAVAGQTLVLERDLPRARQWAELMAMAVERRGQAARVVLADALPADADPLTVRRLRVGGGGAWPIATFADGSGLPLAGGPFGGTTVVVLAKDSSDADRAAWSEIVAKKAIKRRSMFANLALAGPGIATLSEVMADLKKRGRSRVLIVPGEFCVDAAAMRALAEELGAAGNGMDVSWLPGLGAELVR